MSCVRAAKSSSAWPHQVARAPWESVFASSRLCLVGLAPRDSPTCLPSCPRSRIQGPKCSPLRPRPAIRHGSRVSPGVARCWPTSGPSPSPMLQSSGEHLKIPRPTPTLANEIRALGEKLVIFRQGARGHEQEVTSPLCTASEWQSSRPLDPQPSALCTVTNAAAVSTLFLCLRFSTQTLGAVKTFVPRYGNRGRCGSIAYI